MQVHQPTAMPMHLAQPQQAPYGHSRRSPSVGTFSTISSGGGGDRGDRGAPPPAAYRNSPPTVNADLRRSTSSRSNTSLQPVGYVALLRKQKATVWCDRSQSEDPYMMAKQRQAKQRALQAVGSATLGSGSNGGGRTSTGLSSAGGKVVGKIRHHGKPAVVGYAPDNNYVGVGGVPLRLSATEVEGEDSDDDELASQRLHHRRTGSSGRSSTAGSSQGRRGLNYRSSTGSGLQMSGGGSQNSQRWGSGGENTPERNSSFVAGEAPEMRMNDAASGRSGSSGERADDVPDLASHAPRLASNSMMHSALTREKSVKNPDELRRRGSVDERTMTLTSGRLFIANPD
ncbi:hypothetical protein VSDG_06589 [Cytospora chrysosperma]|uniref:Uncharacterized protein n=1 Tax=Cytospora chrysosperma TaxID=252740 RepID=A0A423VNT8_CYTCH|nr:hypothetical protein VSDG_06589 [Valsa sordida]